MKRQLGRSNIEVSAMGMGCWAIGGLFWAGETPLGWGEVDDSESIRAIHTCLDLGVNLFDTASVYGTGHSERIVGQALNGRRDQAVIVTKFGPVFDEKHARPQVVTLLRRAFANPAKTPCAVWERTILIASSSISMIIRSVNLVQCAIRWKSWCKQAKSAPTVGAPISLTVPSFLLKVPIAVPLRLS